MAGFRTAVAALRRGGWINDETRRYPLMAVAGAAWAMAFPMPGFAGLAWLVPGMLFHGAAGLPRAGAFRCGFVAGVVHCLASLRWLLHIPFPAGAVAGWLALSFFLALFPGLWLACCAGFLPGPDGTRPAAPDPAPAGGAGPEILTPFSGGLPAPRPTREGTPDAAVTATGWRGAVARHSTRAAWARFRMPLMAAATWVALEMLQARIFSGFPWNQLGTSQWRQVPLIQMASATGVYGVGFLVCWTSVALTSGCAIALVRPRQRWAWVAETRFPLLVPLAVAAAGTFGIVAERRAAATSTPVPTVRLALVQPSVPQTLLWDPAEAGRSFARAESLSREALASRPDVLVWPEGSFGLSETNYARMTRLAAGAGCEWVFAEVDTEGFGGSRKAYNAAFLVGRDGRVARAYHKRRLVIFGEYVPLARWLPFLRWLTPIGDGFDAGTGPVPMPLAGGRGVASPVICFEDIFPHGVRDHAGPGVDFLLELTNDAWFSEGAAQWQHAANAAFRAVENGLPLVRCTNNGITCWFDHHGALVEALGVAGPAVYRPGVAVFDVPCAGARRTPTFYQRHGDVFGWACVGLAVWAVWRTRGNTAARREGEPA